MAISPEQCNDHTERLAGYLADMEAFIDGELRDFDPVLNKKKIQVQKWLYGWNEKKPHSVPSEYLEYVVGKILEHYNALGWHVKIETQYKYNGDLIWTGDVWLVFSVRSSKKTPTTKGLSLGATIFTGIVVLAAIITIIVTGWMLIK